MSSKKCTLQHQQHGQKIAAKEAQVASSTPSTGGAQTSPLSLADQLNIFRLFSQSSAPGFQAPTMSFPPTPGLMPFAMPQYAALLQSAANMAAVYAQKKSANEQQQFGNKLFAGQKGNNNNFTTSSLFEQHTPKHPVETIKMFQKLLAQQVRHPDHCDKSNFGV